MVTGSTMALIVLQGLIPLAAVIALIIYAVKSGYMSMRAVGIGALIFFLFTQILEKLLHVAVLGLSPGSSVLIAHPVWFAVYGALAAGIFEEIGRYVGFKWMLKHNRDWRDGFSYGIGHGGLEAILIGMSALQTLSFAFMINSGKFEQTLGKQLPAATVQHLKSALLDSPAYLFILGGLERLPALVLQVALSLLVLAAVRNRRFGLVLAAIAFHAAADFGAGLYQAGVMPIWVTELWVWLFGAAAVSLIIRSRSWFSGTAELIDNNG